MQRLLPLALAALAPAVASADTLSSARDQPLREVSHAVAVSVVDGIATYKVQRVFTNPGDVADEARLEITLPYGAAATGLRIRAKDRWYDGELMEATRAEKLYQELTGVGRWEPKDPALLYWAWADRLRLRVFPVFPGATSTVEYTLTVPTRYQGGKVYLAYPRPSAGDGMAPPVVTLTPGWGDATTKVVLDDARIAPGAPVVLTPPVEPAWLAAIDHDVSASYAASELVVPDDAAARERFTEVAVTLELEHTYRSDLRIELYPPAGAPLEVFGGDGGGDNDVRGTFKLALAPGTPIAGTWRLVMSDHARLDTGTLVAWRLAFGDGKRLAVSAADVPVFVPDAPDGDADAGQARFELAPPVIDVVATRYGRVVASSKRAFARLEVDAAPVLRPLPVKAQVVFVVDASHSQTDEGVARQLALIDGYLRHVPDAAVEVVVYRRRARRLWNRFVPAKDVPGALAAAQGTGAFTLGNGSALDEGARVAAAALVGRSGPQRIVITTDDRLRGRWRNDDALAALVGLPAATIVHVVETTAGGDQVEMRREDGHALAPIALAHRGIGAVVDGLDSDDKQRAAHLLGLVRPVRIDNLALVGLELDKVDHSGSMPDRIDEGGGLRVVARPAQAPARLELTGMIWGDGFRRVVLPDATFSQATAAWVFGEDDYHGLSEAEMMTVAMAGRAVSPVTSYLATEPGVRPSTIGLVEHGSGSGSGLGVGLGGLGMRGRGVVQTPDPERLLRAAVAACATSARPPTAPSTPWPASRWCARPACASCA